MQVTLPPGSALELPYPEKTDSVSPHRDIQALAESAERYLLSIMPIGAIMPYTKTTAPPGWHLCDGTPHGSPYLQAVIGSANSPDLRGKFLVGAGSAYALASTGGAETATLTAAELGSHSHTGTSGGQNADHTHTGQPPAVGTDSPGHGHQHPHGGAAGPSQGWRTGLGQKLDTSYTGNTTADHGAIWDAQATTLPAGNHSHGGIAFAVSVAAAADPHTHAAAASSAAGAGASVTRPNMPSHHVLTYIIKG